MSLVVIRTADLERSRAFYATLGLALNVEKHGDGPLHYSCVLDDVVIELYPTKRMPTGGGRLELRVPTPEAAVERLLSSGQISTMPRTVTREFGPEVLVVEDPDGNELELTAA
jgi:catechol 2,3-dioxygenase-like lactoylglutathione lyase family enzyme